MVVACMCRVTGAYVGFLLHRHRQHQSWPPATGRATASAQDAQCSAHSSAHSALRARHARRRPRRSRYHTSTPPMWATCARMGGARVRQPCEHTAEPQAQSLRLRFDARSIHLPDEWRSKTATAFLHSAGSTTARVVLCVWGGGGQGSRAPLSGCNSVAATAADRRQGSLCQLPGRTRPAHPSNIARVLSTASPCRPGSTPARQHTQHATRNTQHATRNTQHATRNTHTQHATRSAPPRAWVN
jgi:hypothetical protein